MTDSDQVESPSATTPREAVRAAQRGAEGFNCYICGEGSEEICVRCTRDACGNHICEKCLRCSDCCTCEQVPV